MSKFKFTFELEQQTPMIHFQSDEPGACLRGSEVKPKLDRFIHKEMIRLRRENELNDSWYVNPNEKEDKPALDYKIKIIPNGVVECSDERIAWMHKAENTESRLNVTKAINKNFFGNMPSLNRMRTLAEKEKEVLNKVKDTVFHSSGLSVTIICFNEELMKRIKRSVTPFFLLNNFGTRQNKGFGSFVTKKCYGYYPVLDENGKKIAKKTVDLSLEEIKGLIVERYPHIFYIDYMNQNMSAGLEKIFSDISIISSLLKSGINFTSRINRGFKEITNTPRDYFKGFAFRRTQNVDVLNDKAFMKKKLLVEDTENLQRKYHRGLLGLPEKYEFNEENGNSLNGKTIKIYNKKDIDIIDKNGNVSKEKEKIGRFNNPIFFKPIGKYLFIIPKEIPEVMFNRDFYFTERNEEGYDFPDSDKITTPTLMTPMENKLYLVNFLIAFMNDFNDKSTPKGGDLSLNEAQNSSLNRAKNLRIKYGRKEA